MTSRGVACDANFFVAFFLLTITLCQLHSMGHFIVELYRTLESGKDTALHRPDDHGNEQLIDTVREGV